MLPAAFRRVCVVGAASAVALTGSPLVGAALAATTLTQSSISPTNGQSVADSKPTITAAYTDNSANAALDPASTITLSSGSGAIACPKVVSGNTISCTPADLLPPGGPYTVAIHAIEAADSTKTADNTSTFTVNTPKRTAASPAEGSTIAALAASPYNGKITVTFDQAVDDSASTISVQQIADRNADGTFSPASHTPLTGQRSFPNDGQLIGGGNDNTATQIAFQPSSSTLANGIYRVSLDVFGTNDDASAISAATENPKAETRDSYTFTVDNTPPAGATNLAAAPATQSNKTAVPLSGNARPGNQITVAVTDGTTSKNNNSTPLTVSGSGCNSATSCPWTVTLDLSSMKEGTLTWTATEANNAGTTTKAGPNFVKDTIAPANPSINTSLPQGSSTLHISGTDNDASLDHYDVTVADTQNHSVHVTLTRAAGGGVSGNGDYSKDIDVSSLDDSVGTDQLTVTVSPIDQYGNVQTTPASTKVTKNVGILLLFGSSYFTLPTSDTASFPTVDGRPNHAVQKPSTIAIEFANPITLTRTDNGKLNKQTFTTPPSYLTEVLSNGADGNNFTVGTAVDATDNRRLLLTPPAGLLDGRYKLHVTVYEANGACDINSDPVPVGNGDSGFGDCPSYDKYVLEPSGNPPPPFVFTVDTQGPAAPVVNTIPEGIVDGANVGDVVVKGTAEPGAVLTLTAKSNNGPGVAQLHQGQPITVGNDGSWSDEETGGAFSALADGVVTITAAVKDAAGNVGSPGTHAITLAARPSVPLNVQTTTSSTGFTLLWSKPAYDGFQPPATGTPTNHITGYRYTYKDTTPGAIDTTTHSVDIANPSAINAGQTGLLTGHAYAVTLCALNGVDGPCNAYSTTLTPAYATTLTGKVSKTPVTYGTSIVLSGRLLRNEGSAGLANKPLTITPHYGATLGTPIATSTDSFGFWSVTISKPAKNAVYVVAFNNGASPDPQYKPSTVAISSLVAPLLKITKLTTRGSSHLYSLTISGTIAPAETGQRIYLYGKAPGTRTYKSIGWTRVTSKQTWAFTKTYSKGTWYVYAVFAAANGNAQAVTPSTHFTRT